MSTSMAGERDAQKIASLEEKIKELTAINEALTRDVELLCIQSQGGGKFRSEAQRVKDIIRNFEARLTAASAEQDRSRHEASAARNASQASDKAVLESEAQNGAACQADNNANEPQVKTLVKDAFYQAEAVSALLQRDQASADASILSAERDSLRADAARASQLEHDLKVADGDRIALKNQLRIATSEREVLQREVYRLREARNEAFQNTNAYHAEVSLLKAERDELRNKVKYMEDQYKASKSSTEELLDQISKLQGEVVALTAECEELQPAAKFMQDQYKAANTSIEELQDVIRKLQADMQELEAYQDKAQVLQLVLNTAREEIQRTTEQRDQAQDQVVEVKKQLAAANEQAEKVPHLQAGCNTLQLELRQVQEELLVACRSLHEEQTLRAEAQEQATKLSHATAREVPARAVQEADSETDERSLSASDEIALQDRVNKLKTQLAQAAEQKVEALIQLAQVKADQGAWQEREKRMQEELLRLRLQETPGSSSPEHALSGSKLSWLFSAKSRRDSSPSRSPSKSADVVDSRDSALARLQAEVCVYKDRASSALEVAKTARQLRAKASMVLSEEAKHSSKLLNEVFLEAGRLKLKYGSGSSGPPSPTPAKSREDDLTQFDRVIGVEVAELLLQNALLLRGVLSH